jgi:hypothetical protein
MKPLQKRLILGSIVLAAAYVATAAFAASAIEKMETEKLARNDAEYVQSNPEEVKNGTGFSQWAGKKGQVVVVGSRFFIPFVVKAELRITREGHEFPVVEGKYLWLPLYTSRLSSDPWECQGMRLSK